jgi:putative transposase
MKTRRSPRKQGYDYHSLGHYFITVVVQDRISHLGTVDSGTIRLSPAGEIVKRCWLNLPEFHDHVTSHAFVVMPNHFHAIIQLDEPEDKAALTSKVSLGTVVRAFKARSCNFIHQAGFHEFAWQRNYYDHIIRNDRSLRIMQLYILSNAALWNFDPENPNYANHSRSVETSTMKEWV